MSTKAVGTAESHYDFGDGHIVDFTDKSAVESSRVGESVGEETVNRNVRYPEVDSVKNSLRLDFLDAAPRNEEFLEQPCVELVEHIHLMQALSLG